METGIFIYQVIAIFLLGLLVGFLGAYRKIKETDNQIDIQKIKQGLSAFVKVLTAIFVVGFILSILLAALLYDGKCPTSYVAYSSESFPCPFWRFYTRLSLLGIFAGDAGPFVPDWR